MSTNIKSDQKFYFMEFTDSDTSSQENDHSEKGKVGSNSKRRSTSNIVMMKTESNSFLNQSSVNANLNSAHSNSNFSLLMFDSCWSSFFQKLF